MPEWLLDIPYQCWLTIGEMAPYLLFGFLVAGLLSVIVSPRLVERHLGGRGAVFQSLKASIFGVPLPLCSCGVIPVAASLRSHGANRGATVAFLISTPQTGVDSLLVTFGLLGPVWVVVRPLVALVTGFTGGIITGWVAPEEASPEGEEAEHASGREGAGRGRVQKSWREGLKEALRHGFVTLPRDIGKPLFFGIVVAGAISAAVPKGSLAGFELLRGGIVPILLIMVLGIPMYVCATSSIPVAAAMIAAGVSPGAALAFLMTGPATNAASVATVWKVMGRRTAVTYLATVVVSALAAGLMLDYVFEITGVPAVAAAPWMLPWWLKAASAIVLVGVVVRAIFTPAECRLPLEPGSPAEGTTELVMSIKGMHCSNCSRAVERALSEDEGVSSAEVSLERSEAVITGPDLEPHRLEDKVNELGYEVEGFEYRHTHDKEERHDEHQGH